MNSVQLALFSREKESPFFWSPREWAVLSRMIKGKTQKEIAYELGIDITTVKCYAAAIREKTEMPSMVSAVAKVYKMHKMKRNALR